LASLCSVKLALWSPPTIKPASVSSDVRARLAQILDLFVEEDWRNVYAGQLEVRPPLEPREC
jgi:hypothetical protein